MLTEYIGERGSIPRLESNVDSYIHFYNSWKIQGFGFAANLKIRNLGRIWKSSDVRQEDF